MTHNPPESHEPPSRRRMRRVSILAAALAALVALAAARPAAAQIPMATGRQIAMSNAAWKIFIPSTYQHRVGEAADLLIHFHGDPQTYWNNAKYANLNAIIVTVNYSGLSSAYSTPFSNASLFQSIIDEAQTKVRAQADFADSMTWTRIGVSSFSAGYGAVREILKSATYRNEINALLAADSLYATTAGDGTPLDSQMVDYKTFASLAKSGQKTFLFSHSQVPTYTYETTGECGDELMQYLGVSPSAYNVNGLGTLNFYRHAKSGNFELWGALGTDGDSHLEHLRYIGEFLEELPLAKLTNYAADFNDDGAVNATDFTTWRTAFAATAAGDTNADGDTDGADFLAWQLQMGLQAAGVAATTAVPEPCGAGAFAVTLAALAQLTHVRARRRPRQSYRMRISPASIPSNPLNPRSAMAAPSAVTWRKYKLVGRWPVKFCVSSWHNRSAASTTNASD